MVDRATRVGLVDARWGVYFCFVVVSACGRIAFDAVTPGAPEADGSVATDAGAFALDGRSTFDAGQNDRIVTGTYLGDGIAGRAVNGLPFRPDVLIIKGVTLQYAVVRMSSMPNDLAKPPLFGPLVPGLVSSLEPDGFTVGSDAKVNAAGVTYYWIAFKQVAGEMHVGSYQGTGADNRSIQGVGFAPDMVWVLGNLNDTAVHRPSTVQGDVTFEFGSVNTATDRIQALEANGFQVGTSSHVNRAATDYFYAAWKSSPGKMAVGTYVGDGMDHRVIAGVGFEPAYVTIKSGDGYTGAHRPSSLAGDATLLWNDNEPVVPGYIESLLPMGFEVGADYHVNGAGATLHYAAFGR